MNRIARSQPDLPRLVRLGIARVGPGWFTSVMGTGILAVCLTISPVPIPFGPAAGRALWVAATALLGVLSLLLLAAAVRSPRAAARLGDPAAAQLWGAPPMACFTIAVGFLKIGPPLLGTPACVATAQALWITGALGSLACALAVPYLMFTRHELTPHTTYGSWLLPVVPPIVASVPAALLSATWPPAIRADMLVAAYALLGIGMALAAIVIVIFYSRLVYASVPEAALVPSLWIVVGPLGQSIAGIIALGEAARTVWATDALAGAALAYGVLAWGFAMYWLTMAIAVTVRAARAHLPFTLGWWAFTFPVGVLTSGTDALYGRTHAGIFAAAAVLLVALLAALWALVAVRTGRAAVQAAGAANRPQVRLATARPAA